MIYAFAGLDGSDGSDNYVIDQPPHQILAPPGIPIGTPGTTVSGPYPALVGPYPNLMQAPGNPNYTQPAIAPALFRSMRSYHPMLPGRAQIAPSRMQSNLPPVPGCGCKGGGGAGGAGQGAPSGFGGLGVLDRSGPGARRYGPGGLRGLGSLGEITTNDILNSGATLAVLVLITAGAAYWFWSSTKDEKPVEGGPSVDWDQLGKEWDEAAQR